MLEVLAAIDSTGACGATAARELLRKGLIEWSGGSPGRWLLTKEGRDRLAVLQSVRR